MSDSLPTLLIVDDDSSFTRVLSRAMKRRGLDVTVAHSAEEAQQVIPSLKPDMVTLDLKMEGASGITLISDIRACNPQARILILTGYASIATAVEAIKLGATQYLPKPADADQILAALDNENANPEVGIEEQPMSVNRLQWEHIQKVLTEHDGNISATARALGMHRRTLQRKLAKRPVRH
ncbi:response regulator transcription factor [Marinobacterium jannaschii]|uniref:response regulator transcription factor n=1 Tax=Marinobacterium jannaschii TaxID=64970 RepID=UPI0004840BF5|nr:response regulator transcription factor [Marinobacterium jannaschii]